MNARVDRLAASGQLRRVDVALADWITRAFPTAAPEVALAAALAARAIADGHSALELARAQDWLDGLEGTGRAPRLPAIDGWLAALRAAPPELPIACDVQGRVYLRRYYDYERAVARGLIARAGANAPVPFLPSPPPRAGEEDKRAPAPQAGEGNEHAATSQASGGSAHADGAPSAAGTRIRGSAESMVPVDPEQRRAIEVALTHRLAIVTGGPGTGKTWSVVRMLIALAARAAGEGRRLGIVLAAPTGKAAARLRQSVRSQLETLRLPADLRVQMPADATTVHRLLGISPRHAAPKHHRDAPLGADVVVVDEVSMVDLPLMAKLVDAVAPEAHLILLGDPKQLAAVEAGDVLGALAAAAEAPPLAGCQVALTVNHRFGTDSVLGQLAAAIADGDADAAIACLGSGGGSGGVSLESAGPRQLVATAAEAYLPVATADSPAAALAAARRYRVLTALRRGPAGCLALDHAIAAAIVRRLGLAPDARWWRGRLVLITANRPELGLYNGDTGVVFPDPDDPRRALKAWFDGADGAARAFAPAALPPHEGAFALTVHKAQGSEFERVALVTGPDSAVLTRELLYTGITRARDGVTLHADAGTVRAGIERPLLRMTGLADRLREATAAD
ncbi:MAG TPA: exodeoxyribonuclease V subunit alpha [Rhodanobacteraceae bacterium]|nr:exodeoxyribonuclease V subunit alpha [Rhodanobacteraceae bacterium]